MNFTDTNSFTGMAKNIGYKFIGLIEYQITMKIFKGRDLRTSDCIIIYEDWLFIKTVHWSVDPFYSCTVYCQLPDNIEWQNGGQIEDELHRFLSQKFDLVYFDCSKMKSDNFCIAEYGKFTRLNLHIRLRKFQTPQSKQQWLFDIFNQVHFRDMVQHHHFKSLFLFQILPEKFYSNHFRLFMNR